jgi:hypothetical protein
MKHPSGAYDWIFIALRLLRVCWYSALSLTRGRVCNLLLLLALASAVIFGFESRGTCEHILLSQIRDFSIRRLLRLAGLRWRYSIPPPYGVLYSVSVSTETPGDPTATSWFPRIYLHRNIFHFRIPGNVFHDELVSKNPSPWKRVCQCVP